MKRLAIFGNMFQGGFLGGLQKFFNCLESRGFEVFIDREFARYLSKQGVLTAACRPVDSFPEEAECVISVGGDGTFLHAAQWVGRRETPILGLNTGHLGFLASYSIDEIDELLDVIGEDRAILERRSLIAMSCDAMPEGFWPYALNEVAVLKAATASMVTVQADIDGYFLADYMSDGLVISTPTGSTAYNLSVGGPIVQPTLDCLVISPIAPHSLTMRPLVVAGNSRIILCASSRAGECRVSLDGRSFMMKCGETLMLKEADFCVSVLRRPDANFPRLLRNKLGWGRGLTSSDD